MKFKWIYLALLLLQISCGRERGNYPETKLISFKSRLLRPSPVEEYLDSVGAKEIIVARRNQDTLEFLIDLPFSGCERFSGDIKVKGDSLILLYKSESDTTCATLEHYELRFTILDELQRDRKIVLRYVD